MWYDDRTRDAHQALVRRQKEQISREHDLPMETFVVYAPMGLPDWAEYPRDTDPLPPDAEEALDPPEDPRRIPTLLGWKELRSNRDGGLTGIPPHRHANGRRRRRVPDYRFDHTAAMVHIIEPLALPYAVVLYPMLDDRAVVQWVALFGYRGRRYTVTGRPLGHVALNLVRALVALHRLHGDELPLGWP